MITEEDLEEIGFFDFAPEKLDKDEILADEIFERIFATNNNADRVRLIGKLEERAAALKVKTTFKKLLQIYQHEYSQRRRQNGSYTMKFTSPPIDGLKCGEWEAVDSGISKVIEQKRIVACPHPILPTERLQNVETDMEKIRLAYFKDSQWKTVTVDRSTIATRTGIVKLSDFGVDVTSETAKDLVSYLGDVLSLNDIPLKKSIARMGWINDKFIPYECGLAFDGEHEFKSLFESVREHGDYNTWINEAKMLREHSIYNRFALSASFASPLIALLGINPFIVHFWGGTGVGKTVALMLAASVWGDPQQGKMVRSLNSTQVGMERNSAFLHDLPFIGDELQIVKSGFENFDKLIMYLCEGVGRGRGRQSGGIEMLQNWHCAYLFSGEEPITKSESGGGAKNRVIEIECKTPLVIDGNKTANLVRDNYGYAGKRFLQVLPSPKELQAMYNDFHRQIMETGTTEKQAMAMAALMVADDIASVELFHDSPLEFEDVAPYVMSAAEVDVAGRAYEWVCDWIGEHNAFFVNGTNEIWGKIDEDKAFINRTVLEREMDDQGFNLKSCLSSWHERGIVKKNSQGKFAHQTKCYNAKASYIVIKL